MMIFERPHQRRERQRGATIIEAIGALGVLALVSVGLTAWIDSQQSQARAHFAGLELDLMRPHAHEVAAQAVAGSLQDGTGQALVLDAANPVIALALPHATVAASVPAKGSTTNGFGHAYCLLLERQADGQIGSLLLTLGGRDMNEGQLADAVSFAGPAAGRLQLSGGTLQAFSAHWARGIGSDAAAVVQASCGQPPAPGHLAALTRYEQGVGGTGQALYRVKVDVSDETAAGRELNTMQHDLSIRGDLVLGLKDVIQEGGTCTPGTHGRTAQGVALECPMATSVWTPLASDTGRSIVGSRLAGDALGLEAAGTQGFDVYTTACPRVGAMRRDEEGGVMACQTAKTDGSGALAWKRVGGAVIKWVMLAQPERALATGIAPYGQLDLKAALADVVGSNEVRLVWMRFKNTYTPGGTTFMYNVCGDGTHMLEVSAMAPSETELIVDISKPCDYNWWPGSSESLDTFTDKYIRFEALGYLCETEDCSATP